MERSRKSMAPNLLAICRITKLAASKTSKAFSSVGCPWIASFASTRTICARSPASAANAFASQRRLMTSRRITSYTKSHRTLPHRLPVTCVTSQYKESTPYHTLTPPSSLQLGSLGKIAKNANKVKNANNAMHDDPPSEADASDPHQGNAVPGQGKRSQGEGGSPRGSPDHLVRLQENGRRNGEAQCLRGLQVDDQLELHGPLDGQLARLRAV